MRRHSVAFAILAGGLIAGLIDITYAVGFIVHAFGIGVPIALASRAAQRSI